VSWAMVVFRARLRVRWGWYHHGPVHKDMLLTCGASLVSNTAARERKPHQGAAIVLQRKGGQEMVGIAVDGVPTFTQTGRQEQIQVSQYGPGSHATSLMY